MLRYAQHDILPFSAASNAPTRPKWLVANLRGRSVHAFDNFIYGASGMAPLLFPNLMVLGIIALWQFRINLTQASPVPADVTRNVTRE
jgi:hypothetical protein